MHIKSQIDGPLASLSLRLCLDERELPQIDFSPIVGGRWLSHDLGLQRVQILERKASISLRVQPSMEHFPEFHALNSGMSTLNQPFQLQFANGQMLVAEQSCLRKFGGIVAPANSWGADFVLDHWRYGELPKAAFWVCEVRGLRLPRGNFSLFEVEPAATGLRPRRSSHGHFRLKGNYIWHLFRDREASSARAIVVTEDRELDCDLLERDFQALQFTFGMPLKLDMAVGLDLELNPVAQLGLRFGFRKLSNGAGVGPVPKFCSSTECWYPVFFNRVATSKIRGLEMAIGAYLDESVDHIDGAYLKLHIALEAFCKSRAPKSQGTLVKDAKNWQSWVESHRAELVEMAADEAALSKFIGKLKSGAIQPPTTDLVASTLEYFGFTVSKEISTEIGKRNKVAHEFLMSNGDYDDIEALVRRVRIIKAILVTLIAKEIGYDGPITGYEWKDNDLAGPSWWPEPASTAEALQTYWCQQVVQPVIRKEDCSAY